MGHVSYQASPFFFFSFCCSENTSASQKLGGYAIAMNPIITVVTQPIPQFHTCLLKVVLAQSCTLSASKQWKPDVHVQIQLETLSAQDHHWWDSRGGKRECAQQFKLSTCVSPLAGSVPSKMGKGMLLNWNLNRNPFLGHVIFRCCFAQDSIQNMRTCSNTLFHLFWLKQHECLKDWAQQWVWLWFASSCKTH